MIKACDVNMAMETPNTSGCKQKQLTRSLERILEDAQFSGELKLSGRKLKDFPRSGKNQSLVKYNLQDTVIADLSRNRFLELPEEITDFSFLERLHLYHNAIRMIPETIAMLQSLSYLDISRNQLSSLPREICRLPLQILLVAHNRLPSLPEELGRMSVLAELDAGCNEISSLPSRIGDLSRLRCLDLRCNLLVHIPIELTYLKLVKLDISENRISVLPSELRKMKSLVNFDLSDNPLTSPPAALCIRGRTHIFKYLERQAAKHERARGGRTKRNEHLELRGHATLDIHSTRRKNSESGYVTCDGLDKRWSQENSFVGVNLDQLDKKKNDQSFMDSLTNLNIVNGSHQTPLSPSEGLRPGVALDQIILSTRSSSISSTNEGDKKSLSHIQTYREYKEALKQQRATEVSNVYRSKELFTASNYHSNNEVDMIGSSIPISTHICAGDTTSKKLLNKFMPPLINHEGINVGVKECYCRSEKCRDKTYKKPSPPLTVSGEVSTKSTSPSHMQKCIKNAAIHSQGENNVDENRMSPSCHRSVTWNTNATDKFSFTMRREFERAKEEAVLIEQLRNQIETRLKMALPENLAPALMDGVVLCHLANHVKLRSVASIHVPSPAVPKLTMARCRRNVDNFLEACRKIGVDENLLCCASDILSGGRGIVQIAVTVAELLKFHESRSPSHNPAHASVTGEVSAE